VDVLAAGGNAVDAAVASAFALAVVLPRAGNLGGGGFAVARLAGRDLALDFRETAPAAAARNQYLAAPADALDGACAVAVPGTVAGLWELHRRHGRLPWSVLVQPAARLATEGFAVDEAFCRAIDRSASRLAAHPGSAALFLVGGRPPRPGEHWANPELGHVLERLAAEGSSAFYAGDVARLIVEEVADGGGLLVASDLRRYRVRWREPLRFTYRGHTVVSMPLPSSGGLTLALLAGLLEPVELSGLGWHSPEHLHLLAEAGRRAFATRNAWLGDPDFVEVPVAELLSEDWLARQRSTIDPERATPSAALSGGPLGAARGGHTTHLSVVGAGGDAVALTTTLNSSFGSAVTARGTGILLNNEMDDFTTRPGRPNVYGLVQGEANAIEPGKRMLSSMAPTIVLRPDGGVRLVTGAAGGPRIISAVFQVLSNVLDFKADVIGAVAAPRIHHQHLPDRLVFEEGGLSARGRAALEALGHELGERESIGHAPSLAFEQGVFVGAAEPRSEGAAGAVD
jgi:gamma-glutamyltranspeptidase/glutathione hydrolase